VDFDDSGHFAFPLDEEELQALERSVASGDLPQLLEPLAAARAFGDAYGLPASTDYDLLELSSEPEDGSGAFMALVRARHGRSSIVLRLMSQPDRVGRPTYWLINDVQRQPVPGGR